MADNSSNITIHIKTPKEKKAVSVNPSGNVSDLRQAVSTEFNTPPDLLTLIFAGKILKDAETLAQHNIKDNLTIHLVIRQNTPAAPSQATPTTTPAATTPPSLGGRPGGGGAPFDLASLAAGMGGGGNMAEMQSAMQQQVMQNPEMMRQMLDNPMVQNIMSNPEVMRSLISANPQMRNLMEQNPEISQMLNNPEMLRQSLEIARNPAMMQEMMRNYDRSLSNLESMPGGMGHLQRIYRDIQEPLFEAANSGGMGGRNPFADLARSQTGTAQQGRENSDPLPNPWASGGGTGGGSTGTGTRPTTTPTSGAPPTPAGLGLGGGAATQAMLDQLSANPELLQNAMQAPYMQGMMEAMQQNPQMMESLLQSNPMFADNPALRDQMRTMMPQMMSQMNQPGFRNMVGNPRALQAMMQIQQGLRTLQQEAPDVLTAAPGMTPTAPGMTPAAPTEPISVSESTPATTAPDMAGMLAMMNMISSQSRGNTVPDRTSSVPPEQRYASQLEQLAGMGFINREQNIQALVSTFGDVNAAIDRLLQNQFR